MRNISFLKTESNTLFWELEKRVVRMGLRETIWKSKHVLRTQIGDKKTISKTNQMKFLVQKWNRKGWGIRPPMFIQNISGGNMAVLFKSKRFTTREMRSLNAGSAIDLRWDFPQVSWGLEIVWEADGWMWKGFLSQTLEGKEVCTMQWIIIELLQYGKHWGE